MEKDFRGQDCRGRSFKGLDLTGADFSDCDVRGVDFSGADLTEAKFCSARMGRTLKMGFTLVVLRLLLSMLASIVDALGIYSLIFLINDKFTIIVVEMLASYGLSFSMLNDYTVDVLAIVTILEFSIWMVVAVNRKRPDYILWFFAVIIAIAVTMIEALSVADTLLGGHSNLITGIVLGAVTGVVLGAVIGIVVVVGTVIVVGAVVGVELEAGVLVLGVVGVAALSGRFNSLKDVIFLMVGAIHIIFGIYLGRRATTKEESQLLFLRGLSLKLACIGSTQFAFATLKEVDFSGADLKYARFKNAKIINCCFQQAQNNHLALTDNTALETRKVRDLVIDGIVNDKNFALLDLYGLDFSGLNLQGLNFSHANLCAANLSHTQMTGTILESWNIDTETRLDNIDCRYYYYLKDGENKRMPPEGEEYKTGEFTRIFQKIANTIDFIAHNEMELAAIKLSVEQVRVESGNDDIRVQAIEEKDGFIVVKVTVPKTEDRGILYHEVNSLKQDYETKIQILMTENHAKLGGLQGNIEILKEQIREQRQALLAAIQPQNFIQIEHHQGEIIMGDKTISTNITGSTVHGSVVTAETVENSFNSQSSESQNELKELVEQLKTLINNSPLPEAAKQKALSKTRDIAEVTKQPKEEQKNIVQKTLGYFDGLADSLENIPETAQKLAKTAAGIASLFGL